MNDEQSLYDVDRVIHEPARLLISTILYTADQADFLYLLNATGLTKGNLSAHLSKLESAEYITIQKIFRGKVPQTICQLTEQGREAFETYRKQMNRLLRSK